MQEYDDIEPIPDNFSSSSKEEIPTFQHEDDIGMQFTPRIEKPEIEN